MPPDARAARLVERVMQCAAGAILLVFGVLLSIVLAWTLWKIGVGAPTHGPMLSITAWLILGALAIFSTIVGARLVWNKPTSHGSLMSTTGWLTLGLVFVGIGVSTSLAATEVGRPISPGFIAATIGFAILCAFAALRAHRQARRVSGGR